MVVIEDASARDDAARSLTTAELMAELAALRAQLHTEQQEVTDDTDAALEGSEDADMCA